MEIPWFQQLHMYDSSYIQGKGGRRAVNRHDHRPAGWVWGARAAMAYPASIVWDSVRANTGFGLVGCRMEVAIATNSRWQAHTHTLQHIVPADRPMLAAANRCAMTVE